MSELSKVGGHVFISYVREDSDRVDELQQILKAAGIAVWRDTADLWPGQDWRVNIRRAITGSALVFIACFSREGQGRRTSYQNEELLLAIDQLRLRRPDDPWLIPVRFDECEIPDFDLGAGRTLASIQRLDLFGSKSAQGSGRLVAAVLRILGRDASVAATVREPERDSRVSVEVSIAEPDSTDAGMRQAVRSVVYVRASEPISDVSACYVTDQGSGGTTGLGYAPSHTSTRVWRIRSTFLLRSVSDVIIGYTTVAAGGKVQWFQWDGYDREYDWSMPGADGSSLSALLQIRKLILSGRGPDQHA